MNFFDADEDEYDSGETCDSSEDEIENTDDILNFCGRITEELHSCFRRNLGKEDYCNDIYEDTFAPSHSGSYSYYSDLLAVAQLNEKADDSPPSKKISNVVEKSGPGSRIVYPCSWKCSGQWNPSLGTGPLEELFHVLELPEPSRSMGNTPTIYSHEWLANSSLPGDYDELIGVDSIDEDYSSFIDIIHRWNDSFSIFPSTSSNDFVSQDYRAFQ